MTNVLSLLTLNVTDDDRDLQDWSTLSVYCGKNQN